MGLEDRLRRLENRPDARECSECRPSPDARGYIVVSEEGRHREQEWCSRCGRPLYCIIQVVYEDEAQEIGEEEAVSWP